MASDQTVYFARQTQRLVLNQPFLIVNRVGQYDVVCTVTGGGLSGQAGAVRHGISRCLENYEPDLRGALKKAGMLHPRCPDGRTEKSRPAQGPPFEAVGKALITGPFESPVRGAFFSTSLIFLGNMFMVLYSLSTKQLGGSHG